MSSHEPLSLFPSRENLPPGEAEALVVRANFRQFRALVAACAMLVEKDRCQKAALHAEIVNHAGLFVSELERVFTAIGRNCRRGIRLDAGRTHSLALTRQLAEPIPRALIAAVERRAGGVHLINQERDGLAEADALTAQADLALVHIVLRPPRARQTFS